MAKAADVPVGAQVVGVEGQHADAQRAGDALAGELAAGGGHAQAFASYERETRGFVAEHQHLGREGTDHFFLGTPAQEECDRSAAARPHLVRLKDYAAGFAAERPSPGRAAR
ncbi:hypothetical protein AB0K12_20370 [Nonomuraea sp. NPDC049419]|uniref:hypothetical protein n=1 Tax=Nonomuraea sp. NPDC049419 TaxID=3155772 RepID=UPI003427036E